MVETIPSYEEMMPAVLKVLMDGQQKPLRQVYDDVAAFYGFSEHQRSLHLPSGKQTYVRSRVGWAKTYLVKAGLIKQPKRGMCEITQRGREALSSGQVINNNYLAQFDTFNRFLSASNESVNTSASGGESGIESSTLAQNDDSQTPTELIAKAFAALDSALADELRPSSLSNWWSI
ncbi:winged helix-turn-helix domain-containing protein [Shewanella algae]|uniref:winged helix-turn-helix domain-containing protein n=1 Tax=Shewanella algae TaxID=38313 RepID=UPI001FBBA4E6|nr:winged helix-turn-helix domain-containing protein [Shewanella algae]